MSTTEKIENIKTEIEILKNDLPPVARIMPQFKKADDLMKQLIEISEKQHREIIELEKCLDLRCE